MKNVALIVSLLLNLAALTFVVILVATPWLDLPLAAYSHQKNCERDFQSLLGYADKLPEANRAQAKQAFAAVLCQKDYQTGQPLATPDFSQLQKLLESQATETPAQ